MVTYHKFRACFVGAALALTLTPPAAHAFCVAGHFPWSSTSTKTLTLDTTFPSAMRAAVQSGVQKWNISGSALSYATPVYSAAWPYAPFNGEYLSFSANLLPVTPGWATGMKTSPSHSTGSILFNSDFSWVNGSQTLPLMIADTATVTVHEVGHQNGMAHNVDCGGPFTSDEAWSVMESVATGTRRDLSNDDIAYQTSEY